MGLITILGWLTEFAAILTASIGAGAWFRFHAVEYGMPRLWDAAPIAGSVGAFVSMAIFAHAGSIRARLVVAGAAALWYAFFDWMMYRDQPSYAEQREYREAYGSCEWVDEVFDGDRDLEEVAD